MRRPLTEEQIAARETLVRRLNGIFQRALPVEGDDSNEARNARRMLHDGMKRGGFSLGDFAVVLDQSHDARSGKGAGERDGLAQQLSDMRDKYLAVRAALHEKRKVEVENIELHNEIRKLRKLKTPDPVVEVKEVDPGWVQSLRRELHEAKAAIAAAGRADEIRQREMKQLVDELALARKALVELDAKATAGLPPDVRELREEIDFLRDCMTRQIARAEGRAVPPFTLASRPDQPDRPDMADLRARAKKMGLKLMVDEATGRYALQDGMMSRVVVGDLDYREIDYWLARRPKTMATMLKGFDAFGRGDAA